MILIFVDMEKDIAFVDVVCEDVNDVPCRGMSLVPDSALYSDEDEVMAAMAAMAVSVKSDPGYSECLSLEESQRVLDRIAKYRRFL